MSGLFGGGKSKSKSSSKPVDVTPDEFVGLREPLVDSLLGLFSTGGPIFTGPQSATAPFTFPGQDTQVQGNPLVAPITGDEQSLLDRIMAQVGQPNPVMLAAQGQLADTLSGKFLTPEGNPFLSAAIQAATRPVIQTFQDVAIPQLKSQFVAAGQRIQPGGSSAFDKAAAIATRGLLDNVADISTKIASANFAAERDRQIQAIAQASQVSSQEINNTINALQAVALPRLIEQFGINQGLQEFNRRVNVLLQALQIAAGKAGPFVGQEMRSSGSSSISPGILPAIGDFVGGFGKLLGSGSAQDSG